MYWLKYIKYPGGRKKEGEKGERKKKEGVGGFSREREEEWEEGWKELDLIDI